MSKYQTLSGFRDYLPAEARRRAAIFDVLRQTFLKYGFDPLETPALESLELMTGKYGDESEQLMYKILKRGAELNRSLDNFNTDKSNSNCLSDAALRYDLTVPLARVVAQYQSEIKLPFKRFQIAPVWRADRPQKGRFREFYQCDADIIGSVDMAADTECLMVGVELLSNIGLDKISIYLNNRKILNGLMDQLNVPNNLRVSVLRVLDKLTKIGRDSVIDELADIGLTRDMSESFIKVVDIPPQEISDTLNYLRETITDSTAIEGLNELEQIINYLNDQPFINQIIISPWLSRGLDYYTGTIYEFTLTDNPEIGTICAGGRYDNLLNQFIGRPTPAVGISLGIDRLLSVVTGEIKNIYSLRSLVIIAGENNRPYGFDIAKRIRDLNIAASVYPRIDDIRSQIGYAVNQQYDYAIIVGDEENFNSTVTLKNLSTREQKTISISDLSTKSFKSDQ